MNNLQNFDYLALMTVSEFRAFRKALTVLMRAGLSTETAADVLITSFRERKGLAKGYRRYAEPADFAK